MLLNPDIRDPPHPLVVLDGANTIHIDGRTDVSMSRREPSRSSNDDDVVAPDGLRALAILVRYLSLVLERERFEGFRDKMKQLAPATEEAAMNYHDYVIEQGRQQGRTEVQRETLTKLLTLKFGPLDTDVVERIEGATPDELERALERILSADTLDAVLAADAAYPAMSRG